MILKGTYLFNPIFLGKYGVKWKHCREQNWSAWNLLKYEATRVVPVKPGQCFIQVRSALCRNSIKTGMFSNSFCINRVHAHLGSWIICWDTDYYVEAVSQTPTNSTHLSDLSVGRGTRRPTATKSVPNERGRINVSNKTKTSSVR